MPPDAAEHSLFERFGRTFTPSQTLYEEGDPSDVCFLIQEGRVRLVKRIRKVERSLMVLRPGDLFGEDALVGAPGAPRSSTAVALTHTKVIAVDRTTFTSLMTSHPEVSERLIQQLVSRIHRAEEQLENAMLRDPPSRVVNTLLRLAFTAGENPPNQAHLALTPLELASRVGLDVDSVKKVMNQLRDGGYLRVDGEDIRLLDLNGLKDLFHVLELKEDVRGGFP